MEKTKSNLEQNAELNAAFAELISYLSTDWSETLYTIMNGSAFLLEVCQTVNQNRATCHAIDDTGFFMVSDMMQSVMALIDHIKPFAEYAAETNGREGMTYDCGDSDEE